jgi:hypothetical protein
MGKNYTINVKAGGVFSKFIFTIQNIQKIDVDFESVYINNCDDRSLTGNENIFNFIFEQNIGENQIPHKCEHLGNYDKLKPIENSDKLNDYKKIVNKLKFNKNFNDIFQKHLNELKIDETFIGLHIRLCDMNIVHAKDYGTVTFDDFINELQKHITNDTRVFVASDNYESIEKLKKILGDKLFYVDNFIRGKNENENTANLQLVNFKNKKLWEEAFIEMLLLSKCGTLICRSSNVNNVSIIYSNTIKKIIRL